MSDVTTKPAISVIVPVFNGEKYVRQSLSMISSQTFSNFGCIVLDDGSTDSTPDYIQRFCRSDPRFSYMTDTQNRGQAARRQQGLDLATGKYVIFLDIDDIYEDTMLQTAFDNAELVNADITIFGCSILDSRRGLTSNTNNIYRNIPSKNPSTFMDILYDKRSTRFQVLRNELWNKLYRREFLISNGFRFNASLRRSDDLAFVIPTLLSADSLSSISEELITYRANLPGSNQTTLESHSLDFLVALGTIYDYLHTTG